MLAAVAAGRYCRQMSKAILTPSYANALAHLPKDALPAALAGFWLAQADAGVPMRDRADVLARVAAVEAKSEHPIARAIVDAAEAEGIALPQVTGFSSVTGYGVRAIAGDQPVEIGADRFMVQLGHDVTAFAATAERLAAEGKSFG